VTEHDSERNPAPFHTTAKSISAAGGQTCKSRASASTAATSCWAPKCWATPQNITFARPRDPSASTAGDGGAVEEFQPAFLANAAYRFRNRTQFWPISAHNHLLLKSDRARVVKPSDSAHFSVRYCLTASPDAIEARLKQLADGTTRMTCINYLEVVTAKCPIRCAISRRRLGRTRPSKSPIMGATDRAGESGRLPGSDRRYRRACAICSRNRVTAVMRKQLQGQFVRQAPFCSWLGGPQFGGGLSRCKVFRGAAASARDELRRITSRRRPLARNNSKPSDRTASDWQDDRPREGAV
jgi:hypothetical protein